MNWGPLYSNPEFEIEFGVRVERPPIQFATYTLIAIAKKRFGLDHSLYTILQILSTVLFKKTPVQLVLQHHDDRISNMSPHFSRVCRRLG